MKAVICDFCGKTIRMDKNENYFVVTKYNGYWKYPESEQHICKDCFEKVK